MDPESAEVFSITCGRKPKITSSAKKSKKPKDEVISMPLTALTNWIPPNGEVMVSRAWAISVGFKVDSADSSQEKAQEVKKYVDAKKEIPTVSTYDFDNDDLP